MVHVQPQPFHAQDVLKTPPPDGWARILLLLAVVCCTLSPPVHVLAQGELSAREHFGQGVERFDANDYEGALAAFRDAYRLQPHPTVLVNIANCYLYLDRPVEAASFFRRYLVETASSIPDQQRREIEEALARAEASQSAIEIIAIPGTEIFIDGGRIGTSPLSDPISINPGPHIIEFSSPSQGVDRQRVHTEAGETLRVEQRPLPHEVADDDASALPVAQNDDTLSGGGRALGWVGAGVAVSAAVAGTIFGINAMNQRDDFEATVRQVQGLSPSDPNAAVLRANGRAIAESRQTNAVVADVLFATSLISAGLCLYGFLRDDTPERPTVDVIASDDMAAISVRGEF